MELVYIDYLLILAYLLLLAFIIFKYAAGQKKFPDFFNAGGNLHWIWIAVSLLGTNIQIEYILASAANGFTHGLAFGSFEWIGSFVLIGTALYIVPYFLRAGVLTLPEYLEYRYDKNLRRIYAAVFIVVNLLMIILILNVSAIFIEKLFDIKRELTIVTVNCYRTGHRRNNYLRRRIKSKASTGSCGHLLFSCCRNRFICFLLH
jgi:solute:Na+ symporter, SSS family